MTPQEIQNSRMRQRRAPRPLPADARFATTVIAESFCARERQRIAIFAAAGGPIDLSFAESHSLEQPRTSCHPQLAHWRSLHWPSQSLCPWRPTQTGPLCGRTSWVTPRLRKGSCCTLHGEADGAVPDKRRSPLYETRDIASASSTSIRTRRQSKNTACGGIQHTSMSSMVRKSAALLDRKRNSV